MTHFASGARASLGIVVLLLGGCNGNDSPTEPTGPPRPLPTRFRLVGSASSTEADGTTVSCSLDFRFELNGNPRETPGQLEYEGIHGGDARRTVLDAAGNGISLQPDVHGDVIVRSLAPNRIQITIPLNATPQGGRFWHELYQLQGTLESNDTATGRWNCAPFDIDSGGWVDTKYTARGTWTLIPNS